MKVRKHILVHPETGDTVTSYEWLEWTDDEFDAHASNPDSGAAIEAEHAKAGDVIVATVDHRSEKDQRAQAGVPA